MAISQASLQFCETDQRTNTSDPDDTQSCLPQHASLPPITLPQSSSPRSKNVSIDFQPRKQEQLFASIEHLLGINRGGNGAHGQDSRLSPIKVSCRPSSAPARQTPRQALGKVQNFSVGSCSDERKGRSTLQHAVSLDDLFALAIDSGLDLLNTSLGLSLIRAVLKQSHPEQWELREMGLPLTPSGKILRPGSWQYFRHLVSPHREKPIRWTAHDYCNHYEYEILTCAYITGAILTRCRAAKLLDEKRWSVLKLAVVDYQHPRWIVMHRALWRIWTFCRIFGSGKEREDDWQGQQAWLEGNTISGDGEPSSRPGSLQSEVLDMPPESFGYGNRSGLSADELKDMIYVWRCLQCLLRDHLQRGPKPEFLRQKHSQGDSALIEETERGWQITDTWIDSLLSLGLAATRHLLSSYVDHPAQVAHKLQWTSRPVTQRRKDDRAFLIDACQRKLTELNLCQ